MKPFSREALKSMSSWRKWSPQVECPAQASCSFGWIVFFSETKATCWKATHLKIPARPKEPEPHGAPALARRSGLRLAQFPAEAKEQSSEALPAPVQASALKRSEKASRFESIPKRAWISGWRIRSTYRYRFPP